VLGPDGLWHGVGRALARLVDSPVAQEREEDPGEPARDLRWAKKTVPGAFRAAQIKDFRFHDLRHSFASRLAMEGVDLLTIRDLMGHKTMAMTLRYSHLSPGHRRTAVERLVTRPMTAESPPMARAE
jgi:integrase